MLSSLLFCSFSPTSLGRWLLLRLTSADTYSVRLKPLLPLLVVLLTSMAALAQQGKNGALTVTGAGQQVNAYTALTANAAAGATSITVTSNALNTNFAANLAAGDLVMIIQMQGATITTTSSSAYGTISNYNGAGLNEIRQVASVSGTTTISFNCGLTNAYTTAGRTQVVRIPRYSSLTFNAGTATAPVTLTAPAWGGATGGVLAVEVAGNVNIGANAGFFANGLGFRGGNLNNASNGPGNNTNTIVSGTSGTGAEKGESIAGSQADYDNLGGRYGYGAPANGGGGGSSHNAAGGGGANGNNGVNYTGTGNPDQNANYTAAWNKESANFATSSSSGGGRGGYTYSNQSLDPANNGPNNTAWGGDSRRTVGGLGGHPLTVSGGRLFLGGGGGAGDENDNVGTAGGNGGGLIYLTVGGNLTSANNTNSGFTAAGASVTGTSANDGAGGGGGGGTIVLNVSGSIISGVVAAAGGTGGSQNIGGGEAEGAGGGGGGGYIVSTKTGSAIFVTNGGVNGTTNSPAVNGTGTPFPPNGATIGGSGQTATSSYAALACTPIPNTLTNANTFSTNTTTLNPSVSASSSPATVSYYTITSLPSSGTLSYNGTALTNANIAATQITNPSLLTYAAAGSANGTSVSFQYTATDANGVTSTSNNNAGTIGSGPATYTLPIAVPPPTCQASYYDNTNVYGGLSGDYYSGYLENGNTGSNITNAIAFFQNNSPGLKRVDQTVNFTNIGSNPNNWGDLSKVSTPDNNGRYTNFSSRYRGSIYITTAGSYTFTLNSDDASYLWIDRAALAPTASNVLINNGNQHSAQAVTSVTVTLTAGLHNVLAFYGQGPTDYVMSFQYSGPDTNNNNVVVPSSVLCAGPAPAADLATTVTGPATLNAGQPSGTYTVSFTNLGSSATSGVTRTVAVPAGATFTQAQLNAIMAQGGTVNTSTNTIDFGTTGNVAANATSSFTFSFTAPTTTGAATVVSNVGQGTGTTDPTLANNTSTLNVTVAPVSDVAATLSGNGPVAPGGAGSFTATFTNNGPNGPATGTSATVQLPAGLGTVTFTNTTANVTPSYNNATGLVTFTGTPLTSLAVGSPVATTINYTQPASGPGVTATAAITTTSNEAGQTANNTATATNATTINADVTTTISGPGSVTQGGQATYDVTSTNNGPSPATGVVQTVTLPSGATNIFITGGGVLSNNNTTVTFPAIGLANGQTVSNSVSFTAPGAAGSNYNVGANISATTNDPNTNNNSASTTTNVTAPAGTNADLGVALSVPASAAPGTPIAFTLTQANSGVATATNVVTTLSLPTGLSTTTLTLPGATGAPGATPNTIVYTGGGALYNGASYNTATGVLTFPTVATQAPGLATATGNVYTINVTTPASGVLSATAAVRASNPDANPGNNVATAQTTVNTTNTADVATALSGPATATAGQPVSYVVTTSNNGPSPATGVVQTVSLPAGLPLTGTGALTIGGAAPTSVNATTGVATYPGGATYNPATGVVTYPAVTLANGGSQSSTLSYAAPGNGNAALTITAQVSSNSTDPSAANNAAQISTALTPSADVQVAISGPATITTGNPVTYAVTTTNNGPSVAGSVATTVQLPTGLSGVVVRDAAGNVLTNSTTTGYSSADGVVRFPAITNQAPGTPAAVTGTITLPAPAASTSPLQPVAMAAVSGAAADPNPGNNTASTVTAIQPATASTADLSTNLSSVATQTPGSPVTFTLTTTSASASTGTATNVAQTVQLPAGLTSNGGTVTVSNNGTYNNATGLVTFPAISLNAGASATNTIAVSQAPGVDPLLAVATATADQTDPNPGNNTFTLKVGITQAVDIATSVTGPATAVPGQSVSYTVVTSNVGASPATGVTQTLTIPAGVTSYSLNGGAPISVNGPATITIPVPGTINPGPANTVTNTVTFTAPASGNFPYTVTGNAQATGDTGTAGNNSSSQTTTLTTAAPVASNVVNTTRQPMANDPAAALPISPLSATGGTGTLRYTVTTLPPSSQGVLYLADGTTPVTAGTLLAAGAESTLTFKPAAGFVGNAAFQYTATDNNGTGRVSNVASYLVPVNGDLASTYYTNTPKGGTTAYQNGNEIARVFDTNGGVATNPNYTQPDPVTTTNGNGNGNTTNVPDNGVRNATTNAAGTTQLANLGLALNSTTGQITVADRTKLVAGTYTVSLTTTDAYGGVTTQSVTFTIGSRPLPVELTAFEAHQARTVDADLTWTTASELNNDHFEVERSFDGQLFSKIGQVAGQGSKPTATSYAYTDKALGVSLQGPAYYRLRQVDRDGASAYSPVRVVRFDGGASKASFAVYPNPATASTTLDLTLVPPGTYTVTLLDAAGRLVRSLTTDAGLTHALDLRDLASGIYLVHLQGTQTGGAPVSLSQRLRKD